MKAEEQKFTDSGVQEMVRQVLLPWYNSFKFFKTYADIDGWRSGSDTTKDNVLDQWIVSRLESLKEKVNAEMQAYRLYEVVPPLFEFLEDLTNWYIRLNRARFWQTEMNADKENAYATLYYCLNTFSTLMAPFAPFLSEHVYQALKEYSGEFDLPVSVHLCDYPQPERTLKQPVLEQSVKRFQHLVVMGRQMRNDLKIKLKTPLSRATVLHRDAAVLADVKRLAAYIESELNIKTLDFSVEENQFIDLYAKANFPLLGKRLGKEMKHFAAAIAKMTAEDIDTLQRNGAFEIDGQQFNGEEIDIFRKAKDGVNAVSNRYISMEFSTELTEELIAEGMVREVISRIQKLRKSQGLDVTDKIVLSLNASAESTPWLEQYQAYVMTETLAVSLDFDLQEGAGERSELELGAVSMSLRKA
ncbi:DUF5915 domain-containing protein [Enterovibrio coralii]|uniref:DUF5915 domain-containing protein n=1 Tax=Enterovibrio coralii TaxID=294935 RepID=UPI000B231A76|nr:DUF5915 domain-containing protein [Enterovibrio coralii]